MSKKQAGAGAPINDAFSTNTLGVARDHPAWRLWNALNELVNVSFLVSHLRDLAKSRAESREWQQWMAGLIAETDPDAATERLGQPPIDNFNPQSLEMLSKGLMDGSRQCGTAIAAIGEGGADALDAAFNPGGRGRSVSLAASLEVMEFQLAILAGWILSPSLAIDENIANLERFGSECTQVREELKAAMKRRVGARDEDDARASAVLAPPLSPAALPAIAGTNENAMLSPAHLLKMFGLPDTKLNALNKRLQRFREANHAGWIEDSNASSREARYLFRIGTVRPILETLQATSD